MHDCLIIGGGAIGLSLSYELAGGGWRVRVVDRGQPGQEASWAGAGIIPPAVEPPGATPLERLTAYSVQLQPEWAAKLRDETGIDNGYRRCGGVYLSDGSLATALDDAAALWRRGGAFVEMLSPQAVAEVEPVFQEAVAAGRVRGGMLLPDEAQIRNPRHLKALAAACQARGVEISAGIEVQDFDVSGGRIKAARTEQGPIAAERFCVTSGAWSGRVLERLGVRMPVKPIRGQIVLLNSSRPVLRRVVYIGPNYFVPRDDGRTLIGSTLEDVGFDCRSTPEAVGELLAFGLSWAPRLRAAAFERAWAGLRPASADGAPYLGPIPGLDNAFVAAGHYRSGLILAPATAVLMAQLLRGEKPALDLEPFRVGREASRGG